MTNYDTTLADLRTKIARRDHLESTIDDMEQQLRVLKQKVRDLDTVRIKEEKDVEKMEGGSLASFFYHVVGKKDEKLDKERQEAYEAKVKYDVAFSDMEALQAELQRARSEFISLANCKNQYEQVFKEKLEYIKETDPVQGEKLGELEASLRYVEGQLVEIEEAISAGDMAAMAAKEALEYLSDADSWSRWDMMGGGLFVTMEKHDALDGAQASIATMQTRLRRFKTELKDITLHTDLNVQVDGFLHFADYFFDGLFVDWVVHSQIRNSVSSVEDTYQKIKTTLTKLKEMKKRTVEEKNRMTSLVNQIVLEEI